MSQSHPKALPYLFLTETWERFGFYVVQGLLILYMTHYFGYSDDTSYAILGIFTALVYITPLAGGYAANHLIGFKACITWGGLLLVLGYALLAFPSLFYPALATIIVGNGFFKPSVSSLLGLQYPAEDTHRDSGFTIFYIGINLGALLAGASSGYIKNYFGWPASFAAASIGLMIGLCTFFFGLKYIKDVSTPEPRLAYWKLLSVCLLAILLISLIFLVHLLVNWLLPCIGVFLLIGLLITTFRQNPSERKPMLQLIALMLASIVFWMLFFQIFYSANLFVDRLVDKNFYGLHLTTTLFYASESVFIILLGPFFAWSWDRLSDQQHNPAAMDKFILGIVFTGLGFLILSAGTHTSAELVNPLWVFSAYLLITIGELLISPIGLSAVTQLAPAHLLGMMMGTWFVATGFGGILAGEIAKLSSVPADVQTMAGKLAIYQQAFLDYAYLAFIVAIILAVVYYMPKMIRSAS
jgi:POT family proton-dependent oligopeptide transporter